MRTQTRSRMRKDRLKWILWVIVLLVSILTCALSIYATWVKWDESPMIIIPEEEPTSTFDIPFPAVTVCSSIKFSHRVINFRAARYAFAAGHDLSPEESQNFYRACLFCGYSSCSGFDDRQANESNIEFITRASPPLQEIIALANFMKEDRFSLEMTFTPVLTEEGLCHTFNLANISEIYHSDILQSDERYLRSSNETEYTPETDLEGHRKSTPSAGEIREEPYNGLYLLLTHFKKDVDHACTVVGEDGFKVFLHAPMEVPHTSHHQPLYLGLNKQVHTSVRPDLTTTSNNVFDLPVEKRQCRYEHENNLRFFKAYTQSNCELECFTNYSLAVCGCVPFYLPRRKNMPICSFRDQNGCIKKLPAQKQKWDFCWGPGSRSEPKLMDGWLGDWSNNVTCNKSIDTVDFECGCLPSCTTLNYEIVTSRNSDFHWNEYFSVRTERETADEDRHDKISVSHLTIRLHDGQFVAKRRVALYGRIDFIANCGGLLGLFMGFSMLSFVELVYFCTLSFCDRCLKFRTRKQDK